MLNSLSDDERQVLIDQLDQIGTVPAEVTDYVVKEFAEITAVIGSLFGAVTVLLARVFLKEQMSKFQWAGILLIFSGVASLTAAA